MWKGLRNVGLHTCALWRGESFYDTTQGFQLSLAYENPALLQKNSWKFLFCQNLLKLEKKGGSFFRFLLFYFMADMEPEIGTGKTVFVIAVVLGCFAVLYPKIFYHMMFEKNKVEKTADPLRSGNSYHFHLHFLSEIYKENRKYPQHSLSTFQLFWWKSRRHEIIMLLLKVSNLESKFPSSHAPKKTKVVESKKWKLFIVLNSPNYYWF